MYKQLYQQLRERVLSGKLPAHTRLPSVRNLARELATSRNTVEGAYQELLAEGYIYSQQRSGYFVSALDHDLAARSAAPNPHPKYHPAQPTVACRYDFHPARLDPESFPLPLWRKCLVDCLRESCQELTRYGDPQGEWDLRCAIQGYLERSRGVVCGPEQIVIGAGLQHGLEIVAHLLQGSHASVAVEDPGYHLPRAVFRNHAWQIVPIAVGPAGLDLEQLKASGSTIVYVTPSHQMPMGCVMPVASRLALIEWAEAGKNFIIEDDYDSELRYLGNPIPSMQGLRPDGNIIYLGTFAKILSPALRLSYLVLPRHCLARYRQLFREYFPVVSLLEQKAMARFMELGHWERHVRRMRIMYKQRHDALLQAVARHFAATATVVGQGAGLHVVLQLTGEHPTEAEIIRRAARAGIQLFPISTFSVTNAPAPTKILLGFGGMTTDEIEAGVALLARLCR